MRKSTKWKTLAAPLIAALALVGGSTAAFASGSGGGGGSGGGSSGGGATGCATVVLDPMYNFGNGGNQRLVVLGNVTNCGSAAAIFTMRATETGTHVDPLCAINPTSYRLPSVAAGASQFWWQASGSGVCLTESYTIRLDVLLNNVVLTSQTATWGTR
jgi:hypothetical protein